MLRCAQHDRAEPFCWLETVKFICTMPYLQNGSDAEELLAQGLDLTWQEVKDYLKRNQALIIPVYFCCFSPSC